LAAGAVPAKGAGQEGVNEMGTYDNDRRVVQNGDGTYTIPNPGDPQGDYQVERGTFGGWVVWNDDHYITDPGDRYNQRHQVWDTADEAITFIIGGPQESGVAA
jgi:hypothetical protein